MATVGSPDVDHQSFWDLINDGDSAAVKGICPPDFDLKSLCPERGITALMALLNPLICKPEGQDAVLELASWMISQGADPTLRASTSTDYTFDFWIDENKEEPDIVVDAAGKSAISVILECRDLIQEMASDEWEQEISWIKKLMGVLTKHQASRCPPERTPIHDGVISMWEQMRQDTDSHDIVFKTRDGTVGAHACILKNSSIVLAAMLMAEMAEGRERCISVKEATSQSINLLMDLVYAGSTSLELELEGTLLALDLAHRWQIHSVVMMLQGALVDMLSEQTFPSIAEAAQLKGLAMLIEACKKFGTASKHVKRELKAGRLPAPVSELMGVTRLNQAKKRRVL